MQQQWLACRDVFVSLIKLSVPASKLTRIQKRCRKSEQAFPY
jgi:hypothetical protein